MRSLILLIFLALSLTAEQPTIDKLGWMSGCWSTGPGNVTVEEHWSKPAAGGMLGYSRTLGSGRSVFLEFMRLETQGTQIIYTPRIGTSQKPVSFRLITLSDKEVIFENPEHDFPQRIIYRYAAGSMKARIEGKQNGRDRSEDFPYRRVACE